MIAFFLLDALVFFGHIGLRSMEVGGWRLKKSSLNLDVDRAYKRFNFVVLTSQQFWLLLWPCGALAHQSSFFSFAFVFDKVAPAFGVWDVLLWLLVWICSFSLFCPCSGLSSMVKRVIGIYLDFFKRFIHMSLLVLSSLLSFSC